MRSLALIFLLSSFVYADLSTEELLNMSLDELLNVKVTSASKKSQSLLESPSAIEIITKEELEILKCNRLSECLEFATGMSSVNGEGNIFSTTTIRGNTLVNYNTNTLLLVDGIPILNTYHGSFNLDMMPLSSIQRIEIVKGANSVLYG
jgi:outer membrane receptor for ferrienterochelin and colicin